MQITYTAQALDLAKYAGGKPSETSMPILRDAADIDLYTKDGWVVIGNATVTVDYLKPEEIDAQRLGALKAELQAVRAENQRKENAILDQISKLQAIGYEVSA